MWEEHLYYNLKLVHSQYFMVYLSINPILIPGAHKMLIKFEIYYSTHINMFLY